MNAIAVIAAAVTIARARQAPRPAFLSLPFPRLEFPPNLTRILPVYVRSRTGDER